MDDETKKTTYWKKPEITRNMGPITQPSNKY